jgi:hypothetical protein
MILLPSWFRTESKGTILVAIIIFGLALIAMGIMAICPRERLRQTGNMSVYNTTEKVYRTERVMGYAPRNGDVTGMPISESYYERNIIAGIVYILMGSINLVILIRYWVKGRNMDAPNQSVKPSP